MGMSGFTDAPEPVVHVEEEIQTNDDPRPPLKIPRLGIAEIVPGNSPID